MDNDNDLVLPLKVSELIPLLNKVYPEKSPSINDTPNEIYFAAGQRDVIRFLNNLKERADKESIL